jgi:glyoxylase-like metal-dependent hydrolase (beta-lactamase superfamily II)
MGVVMIALDLPSNNLAEITLLGTGGGYGESSVVHLGNQNWVIVDSCINPITKESLPLVYLKEIGVDVERNVKLIVCTHWHDDHIRGLSKLLEECKNAKFSFARATDKEKFLKFISLDHEKLNREANNSSTVEFNNCLDIKKKS